MLRVWMINLNHWALTGSQPNGTKPGPLKAARK